MKDGPGLEEVDNERLRLLLDGFLAVSGDLSLGSVLKRLVGIAAELVGARYAALGVLGDENRRLHAFVTHGLSETEVLEIGDEPTGHGILGLVIDRPQPLRLSDIAAHPDSFGFPAGHPPMTSFLGVPIRVGREIFGNLYLTEKVGDADFSDTDEQVIVALASAAGVAIANARLYEEAELARDDQKRLAVYEDRDRIARDLHDLVIQRLFAVALSLESISKRVDDSDVTRRIEQSVDDLDGTIKDIRRTIFSLGTLADAGDLQIEITRLVDRAADTLMFRPTLTFEGPVRSLIPEAVVPDVLAVLSEALSNASRHADATAVDVLIRAGGHGVEVVVTDNGRGIAEHVRESGLGNMRERALKHGGAFAVLSTAGAGTKVEWRVPIA